MARQVMRAGLRLPAIALATFGKSISGRNFGLGSMHSTRNGSPREPSRSQNRRPKRPKHIRTRKSSSYYARSRTARSFKTFGAGASATRKPIARQM